MKPAVSVAERQAALERRHPRWIPRRIDEQLDAAVEEFPDRPYVVTDERSWSYAEIRDWSLKIANGLVAAGVRPGEHVAMVMANYPEFVALRYAIARAGAVCVPVNFLNRQAELRYVLRQSEAVLLVTMDRFRDLDYLAALDELAPGWEQGGGGQDLPDLRQVVIFPTSPEGGRAGARTLADLADQPHEFPPVVGVGADAVADILYTSGTTGQPKGVLLTHDMLLRMAYGSAYSRAFQDARRIVFSLPMYHVFGYVEGMLSVTFVGGSIVPQLVFRPVSMLEAIKRHQVDDALLVPAMSLAVLDELERVPHDLSPLSSVMASGGVAPPNIWDRIESAFGPVEVTTGYGMTETTATVTLTLADDPRERLTTHGRMRLVGAAGDPALGGRLAVIRVADPSTGLTVPNGELGELLARGPAITAGYWKKPDETAAAIDADGWLHTGDLGRLTDDGYIVLAGRLKDCYRCGGEQVMPKEIEDVLMEHPAVEQAFVVPIPDSRMGEVGVAWIVAYPGHSPQPDELISWCKDRLARFKVPRNMLLITPSDIPTTASGRPRKFLLAERAAKVLGDGA